MKPTPRRILVPTDLSPCSECALELATKLAGPFEAEIHLLHVRTSVDSPVLSSDDLGEIENILSSSEVRAREALENAISTATVPIHCQIRRGITPVAAILEAIEELRCELVVMGTHGRRGLKGILVGSVAKEIIRRSPIPVLTTREGTGTSFPPQRILVAYDASEPSLDAVCTTADWASLLSANVTLLHVLESIAYPDFYYLSSPRESQIEIMEHIAQESLNALNQVGEEHLGNVEHEVGVIRGRAAEGIAEYSTTGGFDLVVLATRGLSGISHTLFGSVADRVTQLSKVPVLTVRWTRDTPKRASNAAARPGGHARRQRPADELPPSFSVEQSPEMTVIRLHERDSLAGEDPRLIAGLWDFLDREARAPRPVMVALAPPGLLDPSSLERLVGRPDDWEGPTATEIGRRIVREQNVIQRFVQTIRELDSFVVGVVAGNVALQLAAPLLACDYRIVAADTVFVNTTRSFPRTPLGCMPWLLTRIVGSSNATRLLLDVPSLSADEALSLGLVNHVAAHDRLESEALEIAGRIASVSHAALFALKRAMTASADDFSSYLREERATVERISSHHPTALRA